MEKGTYNTTITQQQQSLETTKDVLTEMMHRILFFLSEKEAARTCVLSKSWRHAWSTLPYLRFHSTRSVTTNYYEFIYNTIQRYHNNNIPIPALDFDLHVENPELDEIWMQRILTSETTSCLNELSLSLGIKVNRKPVFPFSDDILFSGEKLHILKVRATIYAINLGINTVIKCVSLRVLELSVVNLSEDIFQNLVSTCRLLEKVLLFNCIGLKTIKVKNLYCLRKLEITSIEEDGLLEIDNVPSLGSFIYKSDIGFWHAPLPFKTTDATASSLGRSVTQLHLDGMSIDVTFFDMIKSKFPFLESLNLQIRGRASNRLVITSLSLKRLELWFVCGNRSIDVQIYAPNLLSFSYKGHTLPSLLFPTTIALKQIKLYLDLGKPLDTLFLLKMSEVLNLSSKFDIHIELPFSHESPLNTDDVDGFRQNVMFPVTYVQQLILRISLRPQIREHGRVFNAFFSICHPIHVTVFNDNKCFSKLMIREMMENDTTDLKDVLMKHPHTKRWEALTSYWDSDFLDKLADENYLEFKLNWFSHH